MTAAQPLQFLTGDMVVCAGNVRRGPDLSGICREVQEGRQSCKFMV